MWKIQGVKKVAKSNEVHIKKLTLRFTDLVISTKSSQFSTQKEQVTLNYKSDIKNAPDDASGMLQHSVLQSLIRNNREGE